MYKNSGSGWRLAIFLVVGAIIGSILASAVSQTVPILKYGQSIGFSPTTLNLGVMQLTVGLKVNFNLGAAAGLILAWYVYKRF